MKASSVLGGMGAALVAGAAADHAWAESAARAGDTLAAHARDRYAAPAARAGGALLIGGGAWALATADSMGARALAGMAALAGLAVMLRPALVAPDLPTALAAPVTAAGAIGGGAAGASVGGGTGYTVQDYAPGDYSPQAAGGVPAELQEAPGSGAPVLVTAPHPDSKMCQLARFMAARGPQFAPEAAALAAKCAAGEDVPASPAGTTGYRRPMGAARVQRTAARPRPAGGAIARFRG